MPGGVAGGAVRVGRALRQAEVIGRGQLPGSQQQVRTRFFFLVLFEIENVSRHRTTNRGRDL